MQSAGTARFERTDNVSKGVLGCQLQEHVDVVGFSVDFPNQNTDGLSIVGKPQNEMSKDILLQSRSTEFRNENNVVAKPVDTMCLTSKFLVRGIIISHLDNLYQTAKKSIPKIFAGAKSTKDFPELPSVIAKALVRKYPKAKAIKRITLPICADKGRQVRLTPDGLYVACLKTTFPVSFRRQPLAVRGIEFIKRRRRWFLYVQHDVSIPMSTFQATDVVGVDMNSRGNVATISYGAGKVRRLGPDVGSIKFNFRKQRKRHQTNGHTQKAKKVSGKQVIFSRELNHKVSRQIVNIALANRSAIALEDLHPNGKKSKIRAYTQKSQWSFYQLRHFIEYKAAILGIPVLLVNPAYTSQACSRCGCINKPAGKKYRCDCGNFDHRDANASHNIRALGKLKTVAERNTNDSYPGVSMATPKTTSKVVRTETHHEC
jgi:IS605 OrfB family transposase